MAAVNTAFNLKYSASCSMHTANAIVDHHRYTGDRRFAAQMLPVVRDQLGFDRSLLDAGGLIETGPPGSRPDIGIPPLCCGLDWDAYDPPKVGAVAAYNIIYFHAVQQGAYLEEPGRRPGAGARAARRSGGAPTEDQRHVPRRGHRPVPRERVDPPGLPRTPRCLPSSSAWRLRIRPAPSWQHSRRACGRRSARGRSPGQQQPRPRLGHGPADGAL